MSLLGSSFLLSFLGLWILAWLAFNLHLISTYEWVHKVIVFLGLSYLIQDDFFLAPSSFLEISWCHFFNFWVNMPHFPYPFFSWGSSRLFPGSGYYKYTNNSALNIVEHVSLWSNMFIAALFIIGIWKWSLISKFTSWKRRGTYWVNWPYPL